MVDGENVIEYSFDLGVITLKKTSQIRDDVRSIRCRISTSEIESSFKSIKFSGISTVSFYKPVEYYRSIRIIT